MKQIMNYNFAMQMANQRLKKQKTLMNASDYRCPLMIKITVNMKHYGMILFIFELI